MLAPVPALAQDVSGRAAASDGDTLNMTGIIIRLHGIDAPELNQNCTRAGQQWSCGKDAAAKLYELVRGREIQCQQRDMDRYGRIVATCMVGTVDLAVAMVDAGLAVALPDFTDRYVAAEALAREARLGIWGGEFQQPADYRAANPAARPKAISAPRAELPVSAPIPSGIFYRNCSAARAAGAAPLYRGQPGYRPEMDGDGDGVACEPYRGN